MKLKLNPFGKGKASALLVTVFFIVVLTISIGGYMTYVTQQARFGARSQAWNMAMSVAEAGIEEGFEHLNDDSSSLGSDGWSSTSSGVYTLTRTLSGTFSGTYTVIINATNITSPTITSSAYVTPPAIAQKHSSSPFFYAASTANNSAATVTQVARGVQVLLTKPTFFNAAMIARGSINLNGNGVTVDSFDSGISTDNVNGQWASSVSGDKGTVASVGGITNSVSIGNANIYGFLYTGAGEPYAVGPNGAVGTHAWQAANGSGIEPGFYFDDANFTFPSTVLPYSTGLTPPTGSIATVTGSATNSTTIANATSPPGAPPTGDTMSAITTNTSSTTVTTYPGSQSGLVSNLTYVTVTSYPGSSAVNLTTNCVTFTTSTSNPGGPQPCETQSSYTTNVASIPSPKPSGLSTNTSSTTTSSPPAAGTYIGGVTTNFNGGGKKITGYTYNSITGYSYPVTTYTYASTISYTYQTYTYTYPIKTYTYTLYAVTPTYVTNNYDAVLSSGDYYATSLGNTIITGPVTLVMPNGYNIANLTIAPGGSLSVYVGGTTFSLSGNNVINDPGLSQDLIVYCAPTVTSFSLSGNGAMAAVIVAPNANVSLNGGGNNRIDFSGAIMANNITLNGHFNVHYDVALSRIPSPGRYILSSWTEIPVKP